MSILKKEHELNVKTKTITKFQTQEKDLINKLRDRYLATVAEVPIAQKKIRLERAEELYEASGEIEEKENEINTKLKCLNQAREEVEGRGAGNITLTQFNQYNKLSDEEIQDRIKEIERKIVVEVKGHAV